MVSSGKPDEIRHRNSHHVYPKSRVPARYKAKLLGGWIIIPDVPIRAHNYFHTIFGNRTPEEQREFLKKMCDENGILNVNIYVVYKRCFDEVFRGRIAYDDMAEILKEWDLSGSSKVRNADKLTELRKVLNNEISGGIPIRKFKLH